jgi:hypothetical protein
VRFDCEGKGNPSPVLYLMKDWTQLASSQKIFGLTLEFNKTNIDCRDGGVYLCLAQAGQNVANKTMNVNVRCKLFIFDDC